MVLQDPHLPEVEANSTNNSYSLHSSSPNHVLKKTKQCWIMFTGFATPFHVVFVLLPAVNKYPSSVNNNGQKKFKEEGTYFQILWKIT